MRALQASDLLELVERAEARGTTWSALHLLERVSPGQRLEQLAALPLGTRDRRLLELRRRSLDRPLRARERCPACEAELELVLAADDVLTDEPPPGATPEIHIGSLRVCFRLPTSADLLELQGRPDEADPARWLGRRCVVSAERDGAPIEPAEVSAGEIDRIGEAMIEADPQADLMLELHCEACGHPWNGMLDIASFFLTELRALAGRLLAEVHALARGYGWSEAEILAMSGWRRRAYLELLGSSGP